MTTTVAETCESCSGTGWKPVGTGVARCDCWLQAQQVWAEGVPLEFQKARFDTYRPIPGNEKALTAAKAFFGAGRDLYLAGGVGSGKTRLACTVLNELHAIKTQGLFARVPMVLLKLQPSFDQDEGARLLHRLCTVPVLVLDDIGAERDSASDFTRRTLLTVYEERGDKGLRTIWTSNLPLGSSHPSDMTLGEFMGDDRLASRIAGRAAVVLLNVPDQRIRKRQAGDQ